MPVILTRRPARLMPAVAVMIASVAASIAVDRPASAAPAPNPVTPVPGPVAPAVPPPAATDRFGWPLDGPPPVVRRFEPPPRPWLPGHRGVDFGAYPGAAVRAAGPGTVRFAGRVAGRGVVSIDHAGGLRTTYEPVTPVVVAGQAVRAGDLIGALDTGHEGCPVDACLHWGLRRGEVYLDPLALVGRARVRLLPLAAASSTRRHRPN
jgi:murein DD-endopeptidase MepM/ murein hydrolase activator NlpD